MNANVAFEIADLALSIAKLQGSSKVQKGAAVGGTLLKIIKKSVQAYQDHTGKDVDRSLIKLPS